MTKLLILVAGMIGSAASSSMAQVPAELTAPYSADECAACAGWNAEQHAFRLFGNTYWVGTRGLGAILITSAEGHVLIDGGLPDSAPSIIRHVRALGFDIRDVRLLLNSHAHFDHAGGLAALRAASGARVVASAASAPVLEHGRAGANDPQFGSALDFPPVARVDLVGDGETISIGDVSLRAHRTAGHTPGGTSWSWRSCHGERCLVFVYADSLTPVSAPDFRFTGSPAVADFERGFRTLETIPCDVLITPHPDASSMWERLAMGVDGLVEPGGCRDYAARGRQQVERRLETEAGR